MVGIHKKKKTKKMEGKAVGDKVQDKIHDCQVQAYICFKLKTRPVDIRPSTNKLKRFVKNKMKSDT